MSLRTARRQTARTRFRPDGGIERFAAEVVAAATFNYGADKDRKWLAANIIRSKNSGQQAWRDYERIGEVRKAISRASRIAGYARLRCVRVEPDGSDGETVSDGPAAEIVEGIFAPYGGTRGLVDRFFACMKVPGDSYLIRYKADDGDYDGYHFLSADEIERASIEASTFAQQREENIRWITLPSGQGTAEALTREVDAQDMLGRVWLPGRRWVDVPDSPLGALDTECEVLWGLTETMKANIYSRFALAGLMAFPSEITSVKVVGQSAVTGGNILDYIAESMSRNVRDISSASVLLPILLSCKGEQIDQIKHITIDREIFETDLKLRAELIERILFGLDIQVQATKGNEDANHFTAWVQGDEEVRIAVQPDLDTMCWALTRLVLHKQLKEEHEWEDDRIAPLKIAWDMTESATRTNRQEDARQLWDRAAIGNDPMIRAAGMSPSEDKPSEAELIRWAGIKHDNAYLTLCDCQSFEEIDWEQAALFAKIKTGPAEGKQGEDPSAGPGVGEPGKPSEGERSRTKRRSPTPG